MPALIDLMFAVELVRKAMASGQQQKAADALREVARVAEELERELRLTLPR